MKRQRYLAAVICLAAVSFSACSVPVGTEKDTSAVEKENASKKNDSANGLSNSSMNSSADVSGETRLVSVEQVEEYLSLAEYKGIEIEKSDMEVTDAEVEERIGELLQEERQKVGSKGVVKSGDLVTLNYVGTVEGKPFDDNVAYYYDIIVGEGELLPELEEAILGMKKGETKVVTCVYPLDHRSEEVAGKEAEFTITIQSIRRTPKLTDKWVKNNTDYEDAEAYKKAVKETLESEKEEKIKLHIWQTLLTNSEVLEYPKEDMETAISVYKKQISLYAEQAEMELEEFVASQGLTMEAFEEQCQKYAEKKVKQNLVVQAIMDAEGFLLDDEASLAIQDQIMEEYEMSSLADLVDQYSQIEIDESIGLLRVEEFIYENINIIEEINNQ